MTNHAILYGGGLDSTAVLLYLIHTLKIPHSAIELLHVDYGQKAVSGELEAAYHFSGKYKVRLTRLNLPMTYSSATIMRDTPIGTKQSNRLEMRNVALLALAASYLATTYEEAIVHLGFHIEPDDSGFLDARVTYLYNLQAVFNATTSLKVQIAAPLAHMTRLDILYMGFELDGELLTKSYSCYEPSRCGVCVHCVEQQQMTNNLGVPK